MSRLRPSRKPDESRSVLLDQMLETVDREREDLAHRLHDGPQQVMTAIRLLANGARHALAQGDGDRAREGLERLEQLAGEAGDELRRMSGSLHPVVLQQQGLLQALGSLSETLESEYGAEAGFARPRQWPAASGERDPGLYRFAHESSLDAARRGAGSITIELATAGPEVLLSIRYQGCAPPDEFVRTLLSQRARRIGGSLEVTGSDPVAVVLRAPAG